MLQQENDNLKIVIAATRNQRDPIVAPSTSSSSISKRPASQIKKSMEAENLEGAKLKVTKEIAALRMQEAKEVKETAELRIKERKLEYKILLATDLLRVA